MKTRNKLNFVIVHSFKKIGVHYKEPDGFGRLKLLAEFHYETIDEYNTAKLYSNILTQSEHLLDMLEQQIDGLKADSIIADVAQTVHLNCLGYRRNEFEGNLNLETDNVLDINDNFPTGKTISVGIIGNHQLPKVLIDSLIEKQNRPFPVPPVHIETILRFGKTQRIVEFSPDVPQKIDMSKLRASTQERIIKGIQKFNLEIKRIINKKAEKSLLEDRLKNLREAEQRELKKKKEFRHDLPQIQDSIKRVKSWIAEY